MKAAVFKGAGHERALEIETLPDPEPGPHEVVIAVGRCGICGTDLHMTSGHGWNFETGIVPGHEYAGEVVALGKDVSTLKLGDRISGMARAGCGRCEPCHRGMPLLCAEGLGWMGGFGEYTRVHEDAAALLPASLSIADGALVEPLAIGLHGVRMGAMRIGAKVLVLGAGSVGLAAIYWARRLGAARVVAASRSQSRAAMALAMGAHAFIQTGGEDEIAQVVEALGGQSPEIVFECAGAVGMLGQSIAHVRTFGEVVSLGFCTEPDPVVAGIAAFKQVRICFPLGYTPEEFRQVADMFDSGAVDPKTMVTATVALDGLPAELERLRGPNAETKVHVAVAPGSA